MSVLSSELADQAFRANLWVSGYISCANDPKGHQTPDGRKKILKALKMFMKYQSQHNFAMKKDTITIRKDSTNMEEKFKSKDEVKIQAGEV